MSKKAEPKKLFCMIVSREDTPRDRHDWYFRFDFASRKLMVEGYRQYKKTSTGWEITRRYYPQCTPMLPNMITLNEVPLPDDVKKEAIQLFCADIDCSKE